MIFVTTGTQEPFDRLIKAIDEIAYNLPREIIKVQTISSFYKASNVKTAEFISPLEFENFIKNSDLIISHAGTGTIISALTYSKPIIVMPRLIEYGEHRNEHQLATAKNLDRLGYINVVYNERELITKVLEIWPNKLKSLHTIGNKASPELISSIINFMKQ